MAFFFGLLYNDYMNTQITQLAKQAGATTRSGCHGHGDYRTEFQLSDDNIQKFAELIMGECFYCVEIMEKIAHASNADIPPDYDRQTYLKTLEAVTGLMKAHFGVE